MPLAVVGPKRLERERSRPMWGPVKCSPVKVVTVPSSQSLKSIVVSLVALLAAAMLSVSAPPALAAPVLVADTTLVEPGVVRIDSRLDFQGAVGTGTGVL